ncbi:MAG: DMT family transporter, partial [Chloroflexota bacterium]|nr:DMT family transporter [Chloroflexota bacterium]
MTISWPLLIIALWWGINTPLVKVALREFPPLLFNSLRYLLTTILLVSFSWMREGGPRVERSDWKWLFVVGVLGHFLNQVGFILGIASTTASNATLILATTPIWVALFGALLDIERLCSPNLTDSNTRGILGASGYQMHMWNGVSDAKVEDPPRTRDRMD